MHHVLAATQTATTSPPPPTLQRLQAEAGGGGQQYVGVLWQFLRMRQACNHPLLVKGASHGHELAAAEVRGVVECGSMFAGVMSMPVADQVGCL